MHHRCVGGIGPQSGDAPAAHHRGFERRRHSGRDIRDHRADGVLRRNSGGGAGLRHRQGDLRQARRRTGHRSTGPGATGCRAVGREAAGRGTGNATSRSTRRWAKRCAQRPEIPTPYRARRLRGGGLPASCGPRTGPTGRGDRSNSQANGQPTRQANGQPTRQANGQPTRQANGQSTRQEGTG